ncbi:MAG: hypothetical protein GKR88_14080 [Flavobacteriaceae bacterium]|nr:MAG: hypothetical protein GKR88_14080 [Flavobacteriaceae bacterium]
MLCSSCDYFDLQQKQVAKVAIVASVGNEKLTKSDIENLFPGTISKEDSLVLLKSIITNWATQKLLLKKAEENSTLESNKEINKLVTDYRNSLIINNYKEKLVKQKLDTVVSEEEIDAYYESNSFNFRLNEELVKIRYLRFGNTILDKMRIIKLFASSKPEDIEELEQQQLGFKSYRLNDSTWVPLENVLLKIPFSKEKLLKKTKYLPKEDSLDLYLVAVKDVLLRNQIAPKSYITPTIKQMILHKRKLDLIREIEKIILKDATQSKNFKMY